MEQAPFTSLFNTVREPHTDCPRLQPFKEPEGTPDDPIIIHDDPKNEFVAPAIINVLLNNAGAPAAKQEQTGSDEQLSEFQLFRRLVRQMEDAVRGYINGKYDLTFAEFNTIVNKIVYTDNFPLTHDGPGVAAFAAEVERQIPILKLDGSAYFDIMMEGVTNAIESQSEWV